MVKTKTSQKSSKLYFAIIMVFSFIIAVIMTIQIENEWYKPEPRSCNSVEFEVVECREEGDTAYFKFSSPRNAPEISIRVNDNLIGLLEERREIADSVDLATTYKIVPENSDSYSCYSKTKTLTKTDMGTCS